MSKRVADIETLPRSCAEAGTAGVDRRPAVLPVTSGARSLSWMSRGACQQADPELFFPIAAGTSAAARQVEAAKAVCSLCAVRANCLSYALEAMPEGIWGGATQEERRAARGRLISRRPTRSPAT
jgi:WhiB family redox-sensing transcriptional regulator